jgi:dipeptide transport system ATP-binding protein
VSAPVVEAHGLGRVYRARRNWLATRPLVALDAVSCTIEPGRTLAVVGESGCGKSTLGRLVAMIEPPTSGRLVVCGRDVWALRRIERRRLRRHVQMVFQDPFASLDPRRRVAATLDEPLRLNTALTRPERRDRVAQMLVQVGLRPEDGRRHPHAFSGGQRQRIAIARALMLAPAVVVADEPSSALDVSVQAQILNLMRDLQDDFGTAYLFITHDLALVRHLADRVLVLYCGRTAETGDATAVLERPRHPYTRALMAATARAVPTERWNGHTRTHASADEPPSPLRPIEGCAFRDRCPIATARCGEAKPELRMLDGRLVACHNAEQA